MVTHGRSLQDLWKWGRGERREAVLLPRSGVLGIRRMSGCESVVSRWSDNGWSLEIEGEGGAFLTYEEVFLA